MIDFKSHTSNEIDALKQKDLSHDGSISSINSTIGTLQGQIGALDTLTIAHSEQISILQATDIALSGSVAGLTATTVLLANDKVNKTPFDGISVIYRDDADNIQLKYNTTHFKESSLVSGNTREFKLNDLYANLPTSKQDNLTFNYPLSKTDNTIDINLVPTSNYASNLVYTSSNNLIGLISGTSNDLYGIIDTTSNNLISFIGGNSNTLNGIIDTTSNNLAGYIVGTSNSLYNRKVYSSPDNFTIEAPSIYLSSYSTRIDKSYINHLRLSSYGSWILVYEDSLWEIDGLCYIRTNYLNPSIDNIKFLNGSGTSSSIFEIKWWWYRLNSR